VGSTDSGTESETFSSSANPTATDAPTLREQNQLTATLATSDNQTIATDLVPGFAEVFAPLSADFIQVTETGASITANANAVDGGIAREQTAWNLGAVASDAIALTENLGASFAFGAADAASESETASSSASPQARDSSQIIDSNPISSSTISDQDAGREVDFGIAGVSNFQFVSSDAAVFSEVVIVVKNGPPSRIFTVKGSIDTTFNVVGGQ
jgi:hypothetical protein